MFEVLGRKLLGEKGKSAIRSVIVAYAVYLGLSNLDYKVNVSLRVLLFTNLFFSGTIIFQVLSSKDNSSYLKGFFALPFEGNCNASYAAVIGAYTLLTKTIQVYALILAFSNVKLLQIAIVLVQFVYICLAAMVAFAFLKDRIYISALLLILSVASCFVLPEHAVVIAVYGVASAVMFLILRSLDPYRFLVQEKKIKVAKRSEASNFLVTKYILRYMLSNKSYVISGLFMIAFGCFFAKTLEEIGAQNGCVIAMTMVAMNTPLAIVVSSNRVLKKKLDMMPDSLKGFFAPYAGFLFGYNMLGYCLFLGVMYMLGMEIHLLTLICAVAFALQGAILVAVIEYRWTLVNWKVETDLLHHPRKYIVPLILMVEASLLQFV